MMQDATEKKRGAKWAARIMIGVLVVYLCAFLAVVIMDWDWAAFGIMVIYSVMILAVIAGITIALRQRLREIDSGEEEEAKQY